MKLYEVSWWQIKLNLTQAILIILRDRELGVRDNILESAR